MYGYPSRMYCILVAILLIVFLAVPRLRPVALGGLVILGAMLAWGVLQRLRTEAPAQQVERGRPTTPATQLQAIPLEHIELHNLELSGGGAPFRLTGSVSNKSETLLLKSLMLDITRRDCFEGALDPSGCNVLWEVRHWIELSVPPQERRDFAVSIWARGDAPRAVGTTRDEFKIVAANGRLAGNERN